MTIQVAADGSALGNPGPAGWAWYVDDDCWAAGGWPRATNNQGELMAVLDLFRATAGIEEDLLVLCDSQYVIKSITEWMPGWKRRGWRKADGAPVLNGELLRDLDRELAGRRYRFEWVKGHAKHVLNEAADERARGAATAYQRNLPVPSGPGWTLGGFAGGGAPSEPARGDAREAAPGPEPLSLFDVPEAGPPGAEFIVTLTPPQHSALERRAREQNLDPRSTLQRLVAEALAR